MQQIQKKAGKIPYNIQKIKPVTPAQAVLSWQIRKCSIHKSPEEAHQLLQVLCETRALIFYHPAVFSVTGHSCRGDLSTSSFSQNLPDQALQADLLQHNVITEIRSTSITRQR